MRRSTTPAVERHLDDLLDVPSRGKYPVSANPWIVYTAGASLCNGRWSGIYNRKHQPPYVQETLCQLLAGVAGPSHEIRAYAIGEKNVSSSLHSKTEMETRNPPLAKSVPETHLKSHARTRRRSAKNRSPPLMPHARGKHRFQMNGQIANHFSIPHYNYRTASREIPRMITMSTCHV